MEILHTYVVCGEWITIENNVWSFIVDKEKRARILTLKSTTTLEEIKRTICEDYDVERNGVDVEFSYMPTNLIGISDAPPIVLTNDRQVTNFVRYLTKDDKIQLRVHLKSIVENNNKGVDFDLNEMPSDSKDGEFDFKPKETEDCAKESIKRSNFKRDANDHVDGEADLGSGIILENQKKNCQLVDYFTEKQYFKSKGDLKEASEVCAMKFNFDFKITKSNKRWWSIRCIDNVCKWSLRAECLEGSTYFGINKYVGEHTCPPSRKTKFARTPSSKTIGNLVMKKYEGVKEGPKPNDIINIMRTEYGSELSYAHAWESREHAINSVRGIPEKSFQKIPKYLHMLKKANPGTHTSYELDSGGRFKYLFVSFGQSIRGFYKVIRKVIVVDGTFLKNKYKGVLLVATAVDGNSNLYPIAFGIVDSENDLSWEWFLMQLKVVIVDNPGLAFVSDRHFSIANGLRTVYPLAKHGICIHHLLNNVVKFFKIKGLSCLVAKASKAYKVSEFEKLFNHISTLCPELGKYLLDADVEKWTRCLFPGLRYDIRTNNPAESINSVLRTPREYPLIPLLDSIRETLTRWFYERRQESEKHLGPLTPYVEKKVDRRIEKAKTLIAFPITVNRFQVKGEKCDYIVDLEAKTCSCGKFSLGKIPCRHAIKAAFSRGIEIHTLADKEFFASSRRIAYEESINPIDVPEDEWDDPEKVDDSHVLPPETRRGAGRRRKRRHETVEDKIKSSQGSQGSKRHKCSRCGNEGHNRATCDMPI